MFDIKLSSRTTLVVLLFIFIIGLIIRFYNFTSATFGYDQARDAFESMSIFTYDHFKIIGPMTDIRGLHHGTLYWYLISPFYYFSDGNILVVRAFVIVINAVGIFIIYFITKKIFQNSSISLISAFLFAVSYEAVQYARWMSNPSPALITIPISFYGLWRLLNRNPDGLGLFFLFWSMSVHFEFFLVYQIFLLFAILFFLFIRDELKLKTFLIRINAFYFLAGFLVLLPFLISELKFNFQGSKALLDFFSEETHPLRGFISIRDAVIEKYVQNFFLNIFGANMLLAGIFYFIIIMHLVSIIILDRKYRKPLLFILFLYLSPLIVFSFEKFGVYFIMIGVVYPTIMLTSFWLTYILNYQKKYKLYLFFLFLGIFFFLNILLTWRYSSSGEAIFSTQQKLLLKDELKIIDWIYTKSARQPFYINTVTNPLFINTTWAFLFDSYGKSRYGYMPGWLGYPQVGVYGEHVEYANHVPIKGKKFFLIIEPGPGFPEEYPIRYPWYEDTRSRLVESYQSGGVKVEYRILTKERSFDRNELMYFIMSSKRPKTINSDN